MMPYVQPLKQLRELQLQGAVWDAALRFVPAGLVGLSIANFNRNPMYTALKPPVDLLHCTALTEVHIGVAIQPGDLLPPTVVNLSISDCISVQPIMQLQQLQTLKVLNARAEGPQVNIQLNSCTNIQNIRIACACLSGDAMLRAMKAWGQVAALKQLRIGLSEPSSAAVKQFSTLSKLTKLELDRVCWPGETPRERMQQCGKALQCCSGLQELVISTQGFHDERPGARGPEAKPSDDDNSRLAKVISGLSGLRALTVRSSKVMEGCLALLSATQLTRLTVVDSMTQWVTLKHIACTFKGLKSLDVSGNGLLHGAESASSVLDTIAHNLNQLTHLDVSGTEVK